MLEIRGRLVKKGKGGSWPPIFHLALDLRLSEEGEVLAETANVDVGLYWFHTQHFLNNAKSRENS